MREMGPILSSNDEESAQFRPQDGTGRRPGERLTQLEEEMIAYAAAGEWLSGGEGPFDAAGMKAWTAERTVRASVLGHLLISNQWAVNVKGVRLRGVRILGKLDLEDSVLRCPLSLDSCYLDHLEPVCLDRAGAASLSLTGCLLPGFAADMLTVRELSLSSSTLTGPLSLPNAEITGLFSCRGATLASADPDRYSLNADGIKVGGDLYLDQGFHSDGTISLSGATITGLFSCRGATLASTGPDRYSLRAAGIKVGGDLYLGDRFRSDGRISLPGATITGSLVCGDASVVASGYDGITLLADKINVGGNVYFDQGFNSDGPISLSGATITGSLVCRDARVVASGSYRGALRADGIKVGGDLYLGDRFRSDGRISLPGATITGSLVCRDVHVAAGANDSTALLADRMMVGGDVSFDSFSAHGATSFRSVRISGSVYMKQLKLPDTGIALDASGAQIAGVLVWEPGRPISGSVSLDGAEVGKLQDSWLPGAVNGYWPSDGGLRLNGFVYHALGGVPAATLSQRVAWVRSQYRSRPGDGGQAVFAIQPYEQLAAVYRQAGQDTEAQAVTIARYRDQRRLGNLTAYRRAGNWLLDKTIQYGYQNWRAAAGMVTVYLIIVIISILAQHQGVIIPVGDTTNLHPVPVASRCTSDYPCFYPAGYAFDVVVPLINVHQAQYWGINAAAPWGWAWISATWIATVLGWTGATFLVAGLTSIGRRN
jgi:cytoskeletal protein CcmA (bactofilin family)